MHSSCKWEAYISDFSSIESSIFLSKKLVSVPLLLLWIQMRTQCGNCGNLLSPFCHKNYVRIKSYQCWSKLFSWNTFQVRVNYLFSALWKENWENEEFFVVFLRKIVFYLHKSFLLWYYSSTSSIAIRTVWKLRKFTLTIFSQKFRESTIFCK